MELAALERLWFSFVDSGGFFSYPWIGSQVSRSRTLQETYLQANWAVEQRLRPNRELERKVLWCGCLVHIKGLFSLLTNSGQAAKGITEESGHQRLIFPWPVPLLSCDLELSAAHFYLTFLDGFLPFVCPSGSFCPMWALSVVLTSHSNKYISLLMYSLQKWSFGCLRFASWAIYFILSSSTGGESEETFAVYLVPSSPSACAFPG